jgi:hypothetical protein
MRIAALLVLFAAATSAFAKDEPTSVQALEGRGVKAVAQEKLAELIVGNTLLHRNLRSVNQLDMYYRADGNRVYWTGGPGIGRRFEGWYKIRDGKRCELSGGGSEVCFTFFPAENGEFFVCDAAGKCDWIVTIEKGNPLKIE